MRKGTLSRHIERLRRWLAAVMVLALLATPVTGRAKCYIGAYIEQDPIVSGDIERFEQLVGKEHSSYMCYLGYGEPFPAEWVKKVIKHGALPQIAWEPNDGLKQIHDDAYLQRWAQAAGEAERPILLRFASEMNGTWMPYSGDPDLYVRKWRLVYRVIKRIAPNVIMIWCPFATPRRSIPLYYPGDEYIDWVGVNIYAVLYNNGDLSQPARDDQLDNLRYIYSRYGRRKPIAICEYAATHFCSASQKHDSNFAASKMREMYQTVHQEFPNVVLLNWFSVDAASDGLAYNDYAVTTDALALQTYRELISGQYFLAELPLSAPLLAAASWPLQSQIPQTSVPLASSGIPHPGESEVEVVVKGSRPEAVVGRVTLVAAVGSALAAYVVEFYVDGQFVALTNVAPYRASWNAARYQPGVHTVRVVVRDAADQQIAHREAALVVPPRPEE